MTTSEISSITATSAISGGTITDEGSGTVISRGVCWSTEITPTLADSTTSDGAGAGTFISNISGLKGASTYYVRAYATNNSGTGYGMTMSFTTTLGTGGAITDPDGNVYTAVTIGTQTWMKENLKTTKYKDGTVIPLVTDGGAWYALSTTAYCWYNNDAATYKSTYGALYNWYTVSTGKLCPIGWHVPSDAEWTLLTTNFGGELVAGGKLKETGTTHWLSPNTGATNEKNFTALPGGSRYFNGPYDFIGYNGTWWSSTVYNSRDAWRRNINYDNIILNRGNFDTRNGYSVRCLKDNM